MTTKNTYECMNYSFEKKLIVNVRRAVVALRCGIDLKKPLYKRQNNIKIVNR